MESKLEEHVKFYDSFVDRTQQGHKEARIRRDYVNNIQWTDTEADVVKSRGQPLITDNRVKRKTDYFLGIERQTRTNPKAFPRTPEHEDDSESITDALRYVCDNADWDVERSESFDTLIVEGIEGYSIAAKQLPNGEIEIAPKHIPWKRIIYDPDSEDRYFRDSRKKGAWIWSYQDDAEATFPDKSDIIEKAFATQHDEFDDEDGKTKKTIWVDRQTKRIKIIQLYYLEKNVWMHCIFTKSGYLSEPSPSKYLDEYGQPECPIELGGAYVDKDGDRFGLVQDMISLQDMVNKMQSKFVHLLNSNLTWGDARGPDANKVKKEMKKPDGHVVLEGGKFGENFGIIPTDNKASGAFNILQQALASLAEIGGNSLVDDQASGRSKEVTAQNKLIELGPVLDTHRQMSKRVYKQIWNRVRQFWTGEKWVRVTDDENTPRFTMLNQKTTYREALTEKYGQVPEDAMNHPGLDDQFVKNDVSQIDVDIIIEESPDVINIQQEQFQIIAKLAEAYGPEEVPFEKVLRLSQLRGKDAFLEDTKGNDEQRQQQAEIAQQKQQEMEEMQKAAAMKQLEEIDSKIGLNDAKAFEATQKGEAQDLENEITVIAAQSLS